MPSPEAVQKALNAIKRTADYEYFFSQLQSPDWILPLWNARMFQNPPQLVKEGQYISFPQWPESRYLARMASLNPEIVLEVILQIPDTDNVRIYEDLVDATLKMPPKLAARLVKKAKTWARSPYQLLLPRKLGSLIAHLAKGGQVEASLDLAGALLEILPDPTQKDKSETKGGYRLPPEPRPRFDIWEYQEILEKDFPELVKTAGLPAFQLLCDLLETTVRLSQRRTDNKGPDDYSYIWRPAIEEHKQNQPYKLEDMLVAGVRDAAVFLVENKKTEVSEPIKILEGRPWKIFWRIALHILRQFSEAVPEIVASRLTDRTLFDDHEMRHEYALLLGKCFGSLAQEQQQIILDWIEKGPDLQKYVKSREQWTGKPPTDEDKKEYRKGWQLDRLAWLKMHLSGKWKDYYDSLVSELGEPEHPDFSSYSGAAWVGPTSPKSSEELQNMSVADIVVFLQGWQPSEDRGSPSPEGLSRELSTVVAQEPRRFSSESPGLIGLDPTYIRGLLTGFRDALKQKRAFEWPPVFELCQWVVDQPLDIQGQSNRMRDSDPDWGWTRKSIADLLSSGIEEGEGCISFNYRTNVWEILRPLADDPDPTPEHEAQYGDSNMDPATLSVNTTRGEAMHTVVRYALWVSRHFEKLPDGKKRLSLGFNEMPEVRTILEKHLDISQDPSLAIRSVYGQWFPWLVLLDSSWAKNQVAKIFPTTESEQTFNEAAWETYVVFCAPYDNVFDILSDQYAIALERLEVTPKDKRLLADPSERLAEHLMVFYWHGKLDLNGPQGIFAKFWEKASDKLRGHALAFVGETLHRSRDTTPPEILKRLEILWKSRFDVAKMAPEKHKAEMSSFGWWFISKKFDNKWAIEQLIDVLKITGKVKPDHLVVEELAMLSQEMPKETLQCLELMIKGDQEGWGIYSWREHLRTALSNTLQSPDPETVSAAEDFIHYLGSKGYFEFRDLLRGKSDPK